MDGVSPRMVIQGRDRAGPRPARNAHVGKFIGIGINYCDDLFGGADHFLSQSDDEPAFRRWRRRGYAARCGDGMKPPRFLTEGDEMVPEITGLGQQRQQVIRDR